MKIAQPVLEVLDGATVVGNHLILAGQIDRKLYADVNKVLEAIGGKWNRFAKAHVFDMPVADVLDPIMETGEYSRTKQDFGQFDSPPAVVEKVIELAWISAGMSALEPSAGVGNIAAALCAEGANVMAYEIDGRRSDLLAKALRAAPGGVIVVQQDFLTVRAVPIYDRVAMNPPFAGQADIKHVLHAAQFLKPGGRLVSVMSAGILFRQNRAAVEFREFVANHGGSIEPLPDGSFASSGTAVHTCIVHFNA